MYEKVVNFFEENLCIDNIYFRKHYKRWILGILSIVLMGFVVNNILSNLIEDLWLKSVLVIVVDCLITVLALIFIYILPVIEIYNGKLKIDWIRWLMKEEYLSKIKEEQIIRMEKFLKNECEIKNIKSIDIIIEMATQEIDEKYKYKNFVDKYFNNIVLPIIIFVLTIYFTNNNEQLLPEIVVKTVMSVISILIVMYFIQKIRNINITHVSKRETLIDLKRVLNDIKIKWSQ